MQSRSTINSWLMFVTLASPAMIGLSLALYAQNQWQETIPAPELPSWLADLNRKVWEFADNLPLSQSIWDLLAHLNQDDILLGFYLYGMLAWTIVFILPVLGWGWFVGWWKDAELAARPGWVRVLVWAVALPGLLIALVASAAVVIAFALGFIVLLIALAALAGSGSGSSGGTAVDSEGRRFKKNSWTGEYEPDEGLFGQKSDKDMFGNPRVEKDWMGNPKPKTDGLFGREQHSNAGDPLYQPKDQ